MNREAKIRHRAASTIGAAQIDRTQRGQVGEVQKRPNNYNGASLHFHLRPLVAARAREGEVSPHQLHPHPCYRVTPRWMPDCARIVAGVPFPTPDTRGAEEPPLPLCLM